MSIEEVFHRVIEKRKAIEDRNTHKVLDGFNYNYDLPDLMYLPTKDNEHVVACAKSLISGQIRLFRLQSVEFSESFNFHKDYATGLEAPRNIPCRSIDYRDSAKIGDIKYIWEPNRMLFLPQLALAYHQSRDERYLNTAMIHLDNWIEQNSFLMGVNWGSCLELGIRLINWSIAWPLIENKIQARLKEKWIQSIYEHCWAINRYPSKYSSANNHLIGELSGLFIATLALPHFDETEQWRAHAFRGLLDECAKQTHSDGVNKEQAISYQQFVIDFLLLPAAYAKAYERQSGEEAFSFPEVYWKQIEKMIQVIASFSSNGKQVPQIGDEDDGYVIDIGQREFGVYKSILNTGAALFNQSNWRQVGDDFKTNFILELTGGPISSIPSTLPPTSHSYPEGGYYILQNENVSRNTDSLLIDCGPLGYLSLAAHGHADALSFTYTTENTPIFIDPGTYSYHTKRDWRDYFRGTSAHNTVVIDGRDQSQIAGSFMWSHKANASMLQWDEGSRFIGEHDGYNRLKDPVTHRREISFDNVSKSWIIQDNLICSKTHHASIYFHCHPDINANVIGNEVYLRNSKNEVVLTFPDTSNVKLFKGSVEPRAGWWSPSYDEMEETITIIASCGIKGNTCLLTSFYSRSLDAR